MWPGGKAAGFCYYCLIIKKMEWNSAFLGKMFWSCSGEAHLGCLLLSVGAACVPGRIWETRDVLGAYHAEIPFKRIKNRGKKKAKIGRFLQQVGSCSEGFSQDVKHNGGRVVLRFGCWLGLCPPHFQAALQGSGVLWHPPALAFPCWKSGSFAVFHAEFRNYD